MHTRSNFKKQTDSLVCLGDIVGYAANPNECMNIVYQNARIIVPGNHDQGVHWIITQQNQEYLSDCYNSLARAGLDYSTKSLSPQNKKRLAELVERESYVYEEDVLIFTHSQPRYPKKMSIYIEELFDAKEYFFSLFKYEGKTAFVGHAHIPQVYTSRLWGDPPQQIYDGGKIKFISFEKEVNCFHPMLACKQSSPNVSYEKVIDLTEATSALIQVPGLGQPRDNLSYTGWTLYDLDKKELLMRRIPYDISLTQEKIKKACLPEHLAQRLERGE